MSIFVRCIAILLGMSSAAIYAAPTEKTDSAVQAEVPALDPGMDIRQVVALLQQQQQDLVAAQRDQQLALAELSASITDKGAKLKQLEQNHKELESLLKAIEKITDPEGLAMSPKRIIVSTSGVPKMIRKMAEDGVKFKLAVSLHSAIDSVRTTIMPFNETFPLAQLREALQFWYEKTKSRITYEYVVWKGINDNKAAIDALVEFCKFAPAKVNLIEYNPIDDGMFSQASQAAIDAYVNTLERHNITCTVRRSRGKDIDAACGQLANKQDVKIN